MVKLFKLWGSASATFGWASENGGIQNENAYDN